MEKLSFYFTNAKTDIIDEEKIRILKLNQYNSSFNGNPVFIDATTFIMTHCKNDIMLGHLRRLGPNIVMGLNNLNFTDYSEAAKKLSLNKYFKNGFFTDVYGNVLLTSKEILDNEVISTIITYDAIKDESDNLELRDGYWEEIKKIYWFPYATGQKKLNDNNHSLEVKINGVNMCIGYLFYPLDINSEEALQSTNTYVERLAKGATKYDKLILFTSIKLSDIPSFNIRELNRKADYFYLLIQNEELHHAKLIDFQFERGFDSALRGL